jgi:NAD(P)-dependent dehydrogenase (short-subunit alcohol dehydrogenase family)
MPTALVTGATRGLGRALAAALARRGWTLVLTARTTDDLDRTVTEVSELTALAGPAGPGRPSTSTVGVAGDVADAVHRREVVQAVRAAAGGAGLDLLVANASTLGPLPMRHLRDVTVDELAAVLAVNVLAPHELVRSLLPDLEQAGGAFVSLSSDAAVGHYETWGPYGASKAALDHLTLTLGEEEPAVRAWALDPGDMRTAMHQDAFPGEDIGDRPLPEEVAVPAVLALLETRPPSGRLVAAEILAARGSQTAVSR